MGVNEVMKKIFDESQILVPVETGALKASGHLTRAPEYPEQAYVEANITYGNTGEVDYAVFVHEEMENIHTAPTQAKYLETPALRHRTELILAIGRGFIYGIKKGWKR